MSKSFTGINVQWPISELILNGSKTIETRTYKLPDRFIGVEMLLIETPGKNGIFKARIKGIIKFTECINYKSEKDFYADFERHKVSKDSIWSWKDKPKFGWVVQVIKVFDEPVQAPSKKGIVFTNCITLSSN